MKQKILAAVIGVVVLGAGAVALNKKSEPEVAQVVAVKPVTKSIVTPHKVCEEVQVTKQAPVEDEHKVLGTAAGAVIGGVVGNQFGGGSGKTVATIAGTAAGAAVGRNVQDNMQKGDTYTTTEQRCHTENKTETKTIGYDVTYTLDNKQEVIRMEHKPAEKTLPVQDGKVII